MTIQLIQASTDTHLWADSYERDANDVVTLPSEAAEAIAKRLNSAVAPPTSTRYVNPEAHDAYLHGRYLWFSGQNDKAGEYFRKATELQPDYAPGWSGLSIYYGAGAVDGLLDPRTALPAEDAAARKAVILDDALPEAHLAMAATYWLHHWDLARADKEVLGAIELDPKFAEAHHLRAKILAALNRHQEAIAEQKIATELDPFSRPFALSLSYTLARQYDDAITDGLQRLESTPNDATLHGILSWAYRCKGMHKEAVRDVGAILSAPRRQVVRRECPAGFRTGWLQRCRPLADRRPRSKSPPSNMSRLSIWLSSMRSSGNARRRSPCWKKATGSILPMCSTSRTILPIDFLHSDERYRSLVRKIGLPPAW